MKIKEGMYPVAVVDIEVIRADGTVERDRRTNRFKDQGLELLAQRIFEDTSDRIDYLAAGEDDADQDDDAQSLEDELERREVERSIDGRTQTYEAEWLDGAAEGSHREAGLFTASSGGTMISRVTFPVKNIGPDDSIRYYWHITMVRA